MKRITQTSLIALAVLAGGLGIAHAAIPSDSDTIYGCYRKQTGALRVIDRDAHKTCTRLEQAISWPSRIPTPAPTTTSTTTSSTTTSSTTSTTAPPATANKGVHWARVSADLTVESTNDADVSIVTSNNIYVVKFRAIADVSKCAIQATAESSDSLRTVTVYALYPQSIWVREWDETGNLLPTDQLVPFFLTINCPI